MKQLFITDLDHTFLHSTQQVSAYSKSIWNQYAQTTPISVATARSYNKTLEFLQGMHLNSPLILLDGAMVVTPEKELIDIKTLPASIVDAIIHLGEHRYDILPFVISLNDHHSLAESFAVPKRLNHFQSTLITQSYQHDPRIYYPSQLKAPQDTLKVVYMGAEEILRPLSIELKQNFGSDIEVKLSPENYMQCYFLTILHPLGDKAHALKKVCEYLDTPLEHTTVFGDGINDIEMFKLAGRSIAVSNAIKELKAHATLTLPYSNDDDAVARYLSKLKLESYSPLHNG